MQACYITFVAYNQHCCASCILSRAQPADSHLRICYRGAGLPWWCTSFHTLPCFSNTLVAAILWGMREHSSQDCLEGSGLDWQPTACVLAARKASPSRVSVLGCSSAVMWTAAVCAPAASLPRLCDLHTRHKCMAAAAEGRTGTQNKSARCAGRLQLLIGDLAAGQCSAHQGDHLPTPCVTAQGLQAAHLSEA